MPQTFLSPAAGKRSMNMTFLVHRSLLTLFRRCLLLQQVLSAFAARANMSVPELLAKVQQSKELKERVSFEVKKLQARMAQQASVRANPLELFV